MCELITGILGSIGLAMGVGGATVTTGAAAGATVATAASVAAGAAAVAGVAGAAIAGTAAFAKNQAAKKAAKAQNAMTAKLAEQNKENSTGHLEVNKTASGIGENTQIKRTLSSLRVPLAALNPNNKNTEEMLDNVYGVGSNNVTNSTQNMTGLNIG